MDQLIDFFLAYFLPFYDSGLPFNSFPDSVGKLLLSFLIIVDGWIGLSGDICAHDGVGGISFEFLLVVLTVDFEYIFLEVIYDNVSIFNDIVDLGHYISGLAE